MFFSTKRYPQDYLTDKTYLAGVLTGLIGGLAIGLLFAPRSGKDLRDQLSESIDDQTDTVQHQWEKAKSQAKDAVNTVKDEVGQVADKAGDEADQLADEAKDGFNKLKDKTRFF
ncbi:YtxH domain-containing protein [Fibrella sp. WM1]|uniref:YtxH domain-containing protein n=1 Tax=Fibrella musci TaxID=3242485 RepID=UPI003522E86D